MIENKYNKYNKYRSNLFQERYNHFVVNDIFQLFPKKPYKILQLGCNEGFNLIKLKEENPQIYTVGVDILNLDLPQLDQFYQLDLEKEELPFNEQFDIILCLDVLEHLTQPQIVLQKIKPFLKPEGKLYITVPNLMHFSILKNLLVNGNFTYTQIGLLDYDHKHFFTYNNIVSLLRQKQYNIQQIFSFKLRELSFQEKHFVHQLQSIENLPWFFYTTFQYYIKATI